MSLSPRSEHVVILGAGYAGLPCALRLGHEVRKRGPTARVRVTLINREARQELTCELFRTLRTGHAEYFPFLDPIRKAGVQFIEGAVHGIHPSERKIELRGERHQTLTYDSLVIASGGKARVPDIEGMKALIDPPAALERRVFLFRNNLQVQALRMALRRLGWGPERTRHDRDLFVLVLGAGATGLEVAGELANLRGRNHAQRVVLVDGQSELLPDFSPFARGFLKRELSRLRIETVLGSPAFRVTENELHIRNGQVIPWDLIVLCTGNRPGSLLDAFGDARTERGLRARGDLGIVGHPRHFVAGDMTDLTLPDGRRVSGRAQFAVQEGQYLAERLGQSLLGQTNPSKPFTPSELGYLVSLGPYSGFGRLGQEAHSTLGKFFSPFVAGPPVDELKRLAKLKYLASLKLSPWI